MLPSRHLTVLVTLMVVTWSSATTSSTSRSIKGLVSSSSSRDKRDGYGGGGVYGGGYSGGGYGCNCPSQYCDNGADLLLYFGAGALLGLLFSMLQGGMMMMAAQPPPVPPPAPPPMMGRRRSSSGNAEDLAPLAAELASVYVHSRDRPECIKRWVCELGQRSVKLGGLPARLAPISGVLLNWLLDDVAPPLLDDADKFNCAILAPKCQQPWKPLPVPYN